MRESQCEWKEILFEIDEFRHAIYWMAWNNIGLTLWQHADKISEFEAKIPSFLK